MNIRVSVVKIYGSCTLTTTNDKCVKTELKSRIGTYCTSIVCET